MAPNVILTVDLHLDVLSRYIKHFEKKTNSGITPSVPRSTPKVRSQQT